MQTGSFRIWEETGDIGRVSQIVHVSPHPFRFEVGARGVWVRPCGVNGDDTGQAIDGALNTPQARQLAALILRETSPQVVALRRLADRLGDGPDAPALENLARLAIQAATNESPEMEALRTLTAQLISWGRTGGASPASLHAGAHIGIEAVGESQNWRLPTDGPKLGDSPPVDSEEWGAKPEIFGVCPHSDGMLHSFVWNSDGYRCQHCYILGTLAQELQGENSVGVLTEAGGGWEAVAPALRMLAAEPHNMRQIARDRLRFLANLAEEADKYSAFLQEACERWPGHPDLDPSVTDADVAEWFGNWIIRVRSGNPNDAATVESDSLAMLAERRERIGELERERERLDILAGERHSRLLDLEAAAHVRADRIDQLTRHRDRLAARLSEIAAKPLISEGPETDYTDSGDLIADHDALIMMARERIPLLAAIRLEGPATE